MKKDKDIYTEVTDKIIAAIEAGTAPWIKPWKTGISGGNGTMPMNAHSGQYYRGVNVLLLWMTADAGGYNSNQWMTFKQALEIGGNVKKGEKGTEVIFYKQVTLKNDEADKDEKAQTVPMLRTFHVFNVEQMENLPASMFEPKEMVVNLPLDERVENTVKKCGAVIKFGGDKAFFSPARDMIAMPEPDAFNSPTDFYGTMLHELTHWTGHENRLNRKMTCKKWGDESYAFEELIAELGAAYLCTHYQLDGKLQHADYIAGWLKVLKSDKKAIFTAAAQASKASDYILQAEVA